MAEEPLPLQLDEEEKPGGSTPAPFSPPAPSEVFLALNRSLTPRWRQCYGPVATPPPVEREQGSLLLGVYGTECLIASFARDPQHAAQILSDSAAIEKVLGIAETVRGRHQRLQALAAADEWESFRRETDALQQERCAALIEQRDAALSRLLPAGAWMRAMETEAALLAADKKSETSFVSIHPSTLDWLDAEISSLDAASQSLRSISRCRTVSKRLRKLIVLPANASRETVQQRRAAIAEALQETVARFHKP